MTTRTTIGHKKPSFLTWNFIYGQSTNLIKQLSMTPTNDDVVKGYHNLCQQAVFKFKSKQKLFPFKWYRSHFKIRHDLDVDVCKVDGDPQQVVRCVLCDWVYDMRSKAKRWHKPNVLKHLLSHKHWDKLNTTTNGGGQVVVDTIQHKE